jgi:hypothetical protein
MKKRLDLAGKRFGKLVCIKDVGRSKNKNRLWLCRCDCGKETTVVGSDIANGHTKSCGCYQQQQIGERYGRLTVIQEAAKRKGLKYYLCRCDCGKETITLGSRLIRGKVKSCGCLIHDTKPGMIHGLSKDNNGKKTRLFNIWTGIKTRCFNKKVRAYSRYGGRGITLSQEWLDFTIFHSWALLNGYQKNLTIERINNDGNYEPENCTWITIGEQAKNRCTTKRRAAA